MIGASGHRADVSRRRLEAQGFVGLESNKTVKLTGLDCRSVSCVANMKWPDGEKASAEMTDVICAMGPAAENAVRYLTLDQDHGNTATLVLDWSETGSSPPQNKMSK